MDCVPSEAMTLRIEIGNLTSAINGEASLPELLLRITAKLEISADGATIYAEPDFPVVELAYHLQAWVKAGEKERPDFVLDSMESDEIGLVRIVKRDRGWSIGSCHEQFEPSIMSLSEIDEAVISFVNEVRRRCNDELGTDLRDVLH
jgi:hypothetical protein